MKPFTNNIINLNTGDRIYLFSDGFYDQFGGKKNKKFMIRRFRNLLLEISKSSIHEQKKSLEDTFTQWKGNNEQVDDICIIGLELANNNQNII